MKTAITTKSSEGTWVVGGYQTDKHGDPSVRRGGMHPAGRIKFFDHEAFTQVGSVSNTLALHGISTTQE